MIVMIIGFVILDRGLNLPDWASCDKRPFTLKLVSMPISVQRRLSLKATQEFQEIYEEEFGESLSEDEAQHRGVQLLRFFGILTRPNGAPAADVRADVSSEI
jgi:hypothetical protein